MRGTLSLFLSVFLTDVLVDFFFVSLAVVLVEEEDFLDTEVVLPDDDTAVVLLVSDVFTDLDAVDLFVADAAAFLVDAAAAEDLLVSDIFVSLALSRSF